MKHLLTFLLVLFVAFNCVQADLTETEVAALKEAHVAAKDVEQQKASAKTAADAVVVEKQTALDNAQAVQAEKQEAYNNAADADKEAALAALNEAKAVTEAKQIALNNAQSEAEQANQELVDAQTALAEASEALDSALAAYDEAEQEETNITDPELDDYLDRAFPVYGGKGVVILSAYYDDFINYGAGNSSYSWFEIIANTLATSSEEYVDDPDAEGQQDTSYGGRFDRAAANGLQVWQDTEKLQELRSDAVSTYQDTYGLGSSAVPTQDWSFVIDLETQEILHAFKASDFGSDSEGNYTFNRDAGNNFTSHRSSVGNTLVVNDGDNGSQEYKVVGAVQYSPIIIDMDNNQQPGVSRNIWTPHSPAFFGERVAIFDMSGTGREDLVEWVKTTDALLARPEADGSIKNAHNLFGTAGGYKDGYEKMAKILDLDNNGWVEKDELQGLYLWFDKNGNAKADAGELKTVQEMGVERISVKHENFKSECYINGKKVVTWDWWPSGKELLKVKKQK